ncbi:MAG: PD-(D/E)XK nuclease family protein [Tenuifilaceae bacterium]|jgi:hypothetical protein|nr:PD-(D/E)XK nuclease family protein [Tenuifilaceae bacterium]
MNEKLQLYNFINDPNLDKLDSITRKFNPFNVLGVEEMEIKHSNFLGWLLDPNENHNLGDYLLKRFLTKAITENFDVLDKKIDISSVYLSDLSDAEVYREKAHVDILIVSERNKLVVIIENKINAKESKDQLKNYLTNTINQYDKYRIIPIYLTLYGDEPENCKDYLPFSHEQVYSLIKDCLDLKKDSMRQEIGLFISYYLKTLEKKLDMDEELKKMCNDIYNAHKETIKLILKVADEDSLQKSFEGFINTQNELKVFFINNNKLWFLPKMFIEKVPENNAGWVIPYPFAFWFRRRKNNKLSFHIEIGPFVNPEKRIDFMNHLMSYGYQVKETSKSINSIYTKIYSTYYDISDFDDNNEVLGAITDMYSKAKDEINKFYEAVSGYNFS